MSRKVQSNSKFCAKIENNEVQLFDCSKPSLKCIARLKPNEDVKFTCLSFHPQDESALLVGQSNGTISWVNCIKGVITDSH